MALLRRLSSVAAKSVRVHPRDFINVPRQRRYAWPRFAVMLVAKEHGRTMEQIARQLGGLDHTAVCHGIRRAGELEAERGSFRWLTRRLREEAGR